jgi:hypothetical protein
MAETRNTIKFELRGQFATLGANVAAFTNILTVNVLAFTNNLRPICNSKVLKVGPQDFLALLTPSVKRASTSHLVKNCLFVPTIELLLQIHNKRCLFAYLFLNCSNSEKLNLKLSNLVF